MGKEGAGEDEFVCINQALGRVHSLLACGPRTQVLTLASRPVMVHVVVAAASATAVHCTAQHVSGTASLLHTSSSYFAQGRPVGGGVRVAVAATAVEAEAETPGALQDGSQHK